MILKNNHKAAENHIADDKIISLLKINNGNAWEYVYNRYVLMMYGEVLRMTGNKIASEEILVKAFTEFKQKKIFLETKTSLFVTLFHYTHDTAVQYVISKGIKLKIQKSATTKRSFKKAL